MLELFLIGAIVVIFVLIFGSADSKRTALNIVGLDLSEENYQKQKAKEFTINCKKAMQIAIDKYNVKGQNEKMFLDKLYNILFISTTGPYIYERNDDRYEWDINGDPNPPFIQLPNYNLEVENRFALFASHVAKRRLAILSDSNTKPLIETCDFSSKNDLKKYIAILWQNYQYPWPDDWMEK